jgi:BirA family biotin operon repressor/biotin-[acetyl-CoA-carboxylase] ligase
MAVGAPATKVLRWPAEAVWEAVAPRLAGFSVEILPTLPSTNTALMERARAGRAEPIALVAERQSAGRGRMGRQWLSESPDTGPAPLTFSIGLPLTPRDWSGLSLAVGLAVAHSLHADIQLKWPNDVWLHGRKLGGILIETASMGALRYAVIGIGINIGPRAAEGLRTPPAWLQELLPDSEAAQAFGLIAPAVVNAVLDFADQGMDPLLGAYDARDALRGREVLCSDGLSGIARGIDGQGALLLETAQGLQKISSAEVSVRPV